MTIKKYFGLTDIINLPFRLSIYNDITKLTVWDLM